MEDSKFALGNISFNIIDTDRENYTDNIDSNLTILEQITQYTPKGWEECFSQEVFLIISEKVKGLGEYYPRPNLLFNIFHLCPPEKIKVVIMGQDPYPNINNAMGISFGVPEGVRAPPSLINIFREINREYPDFQNPRDGNLISWIRQGVFLLNICLTFFPGLNLTSRLKKGLWAPFFKPVITNICRVNPNVVFILWGEDAKSINELLPSSVKVLSCSHPSSRNTNGGFIGCGHFKETNEYLASKGIKQINWFL